MKRHDIKVLREAGLSGPKVAEEAEVSLRTVRRIDLEDPPASLVDGLARARGVGRPSKAEAFRGFVAEVQSATSPAPRTRPTCSSRSSTSAT